jgi:hypothetical protein
LMAHQNIDQRRAKIKMLIEQGFSFNSKTKNEIASEFNCHRSAIEADIIYFQNVNNPITIYPSKNVKSRVKNRDNDTCQYCGDQNSLHVIEHIIPAALGGVAREYNLVVACQKCNAIKDRSIWIPKNIYAITSNNPEWRKKILALADRNCSVDHSCKKESNEIVNEDNIEIEKRQEEDRLRWEAGERRRQQAELRAKETAKFEELERQATDWHRAQGIKEYVDALEASLPEEELARRREYIVWARGKIDWLDPLTAKEDRILGKREPKV